jgi:Fe-S-cluster-containing dehydrogenase component
MKAVLFDGPGCIGCRACENACKIKYNLPPIDMSGIDVGAQLPAEPTTGEKTMTHQ